MAYFISDSCRGEKCGFELSQVEIDNRIAQSTDRHCGEPAEHKVEETIFGDDPIPHRHPLTQYLCHKHYRAIMGPAADNRLDEF